MLNTDLTRLSSPLFDGISLEDRRAVLDCIGFHVKAYKKGAVIALEAEAIRSIGMVLFGSVDMVKADHWGNQTMLVRMKENDLFGETFACGLDPHSTVSYLVSEDTEVLFLHFDLVMCSCTMACSFHHQLIKNMLRIIARKNRDLIQKVEVVSKRSIREKLLAYLFIQSQKQGSPSFEIPLGRLELADYLCVDRSALARELGAMKKEGLIDFEKNRFRLLSIK